MRTFSAAGKRHVSSALRRIVAGIETGADLQTTTRRLQRVLMALAQTPAQAVTAMGVMNASSRTEVMEGFKSANPSLTQEQLEDIADYWEQHKDVVKDQHTA